HRLHPTHRTVHRKGLKSMGISFESDSETRGNGEDQCGDPRYPGVCGVWCSDIVVMLHGGPARDSQFSLILKPFAQKKI
ncbi:hypothetical protein, partial [Tistrella bauzanensis]|uniref:hypothetical protein n=1 Tax=Tistrella bauzanensis TaxID=657419 RepID=UPI001E51CB96